MVFSWISETYQTVIYDWTDPRTNHLFLGKGPGPILAIIVSYILFIKKIGPEYMKERPAFQIKNVIIAYNALQVAACLVYFYYMLKFTLTINYSCQAEFPYSEKKYIYGAELINYYNYFKIVDLMDTVFFVLKKNYHQITLLHVYHHSMMVVMGHISLKYCKSEYIAFVPLINTAVHAVMYGYYLLTAYDPKYKKSIWWKKHLTQMQLLQFTMFLFIYVRPLFNSYCNFPTFFALLLLFQNSVVTVLFINFYYKTYIKKKEVKTN